MYDWGHLYGEITTVHTPPQWLGYAAAVVDSGPVTLCNLNPCIKSMLDLLRIRLTSDTAPEVCIVPCISL